MASNRACFWLAAALLACAGSAVAQRVSDVRNTPHNLSTTGYTVGTDARTVKATTENQICVFCHTPHAATAGVTPLWNRTLSSQTYTTYTSTSLDANAIQGSLDQPGGSSKLCLSCHDGTLALGNVNVLNGQPNATIAITGTGAGGVIPPGSGTTTGFTRSLGADLTNDHPISLNYTTALANRDGELRVVDASQKSPAGSGTVIGVRSSGYRPLLPLESTGGGNVGQMQCGTCHDPHIRETNTALGNQKFLRANRFQESLAAATFSQANDQICLGCHDKLLSNNIWAYSAHANPLVAIQTYLGPASDPNSPAGRRQFPDNLPVWKAGCLNCHDTHTVQGARRLLREGTDSVASPKAGGAAALEETCYQCHRDAAGSAITTTPTAAPNIRDDFQLARRMPITGVEVHDIGGTFTEFNIDCTGTTDKCGANMIEQRSKLGLGNLSNRHAECTDCHNPHRVVKFRDFRGNPVGNITGTPDAGATHLHTDGGGYIHSNLISGALRGAWGVEPIYGSASFHGVPSGYTVKRGDPGSSVDTSVTASYVTREYQICLKCHSDYGYTDDNVYPSGNTRPQLGGTGLTPVARPNDGRNHTRYTNQAKEFQAPPAHAVAVGSVNLGNNGGTGTAASNNNNHRSWHPVFAPTGRTNRPGAWLRPWNNTGTGGQAGRLGIQTMFCTDCHGSNTAAGTVIPTSPSPWGPHGSANNFILKGEWDNLSGEGNANTLCFRCHSQAAYSGGGGTGWNTDKGDGHDVHSQRIDTAMRCSFCHVAVPHGWKNRGLLVNLLDVGAEAGLPAGTAVAFTNNVGYTNGPYYRRAFLRVISFPAAGQQWTEGNCNGGSKDTMKTNCEVPN